MHNEKPLKEKLLLEIQELQKRIVMLEASEGEHWHVEEGLRQSEERLRGAYHELEKRFAERTSQLARVIENLQEEIFERRKTEDALRKSEERYALAVEGANDGIWDRDFASGKIYFSPRWKCMLGYEDHEIQNSREEWLKRVHPDDVEMVTRHLSDYLEGRIPAYKIEYRMLHKDGSYRWILAKGACLRDPQGKPYRMAGSHTDIDAGKHAAEELRKNEELLRTILETLPVGVAVFDWAGKSILENQAKRAIWGLGNGKGESLDDYKGWFTDSGEPVNRDEWPVYRACSKGVSETKIIDIEGFDGITRTVVVSATPLKINGQIVAGISVVEDITEHRVLEQKLLQAQKMESIGLLAGGLAHEFNNLLTAISGFAEELMDASGKHDKAMRSNISMILSASREAAELTRNLLAFSRQQIFNMGPVAVNDIIADTGKLLIKTLGPNIHFSTDLSIEELTVMADGGQIKQVLVNLAINARDAMPSGGKLEIRTRQTILDEEMMRNYGLGKPGCYVVISVSDSGAGMDERTKEKIFDPFFTTKEVGKGTGLGLSIAYGIIRQHNGAISVESGIGRGSTFTIHLPHVKAQISREQKQDGILPSGGAETILLAEDEELVRFFLAKTLERAGYRLITAEDGEEGLRKFEENRDNVSLVISDMVMPKKNGLEMYDEISGIKPGTKVLFISGYSTDMIKVKGEAEENIDFITKPFVKKDLLDKVRKILDVSPVTK